MAESGPSNLNQTIVNSRCVLFVGAGASAPLEMLPTAPFLKLLETELLKSMVDSEKLMPQTTSVNLDNWIKDFFNQAGRYHESKTPDSEMVLDYLEHLTESCEELKSLPQLFAELAGYAGSPNLHGDWSAVFSRVKGYIQEIIVKHYSSVKGRKALDLYEPLLNLIGAETKAIPIFITNYDWAFERLAQEAKQEIHLVDGFETDSMGSYWERGVFDGFALPNAKTISLVLFKLHGSTSWFREQNNPDSIRKSPNPVMESAVLIYPTTQIKQQTTIDEPFKTGYEYLQKCLNHAELCVVIGFSFRDEAIKQVFGGALETNHNLKLAIVDPTLHIKEPRFEKLLGDLRLKSDDWGGKLHVIKAHFGHDKAKSEIETRIRNRSEWDTLNPYVTE